MAPLRTAVALTCALLLASPAFAADYHLETAPRRVRSDVAQQSRAVGQVGEKAKVVRRFVSGTGWTWFLRVGDYGSEGEAREAARRIADAVGEAVVIFVTDEGTTEELDRARPAPTASAPASAAPATPRRPAPSEPPPTDAEGVLARASRAHGGVDGGIAALRAAPGVVFTFRRTLPDGLVVDHAWGRDGERRCLEVIPVEGDARASRVVHEGASAWLGVDGGALEPADAGRAADTLALVHPTRIVPFVLSFADLLENRRELEGLELLGRGDLDGRPVYDLGYDGDQNAGPLALRIDAETFHIAEVSFEQGELVHRFDGWTSTAGVALPARVRTWRHGELADTVEIRALRPERPPESLCGAPQ